MTKVRKPSCRGLGRRRRHLWGTLGATPAVHKAAAGCGLAGRTAAAAAALAAGCAGPQVQQTTLACMTCRLQHIARVCCLLCSRRPPTFAASAMRRSMLPTGRSSPPSPTCVNRERARGRAGVRPQRATEDGVAGRTQLHKRRQAHATRLRLRLLRGVVGRHACLLPGPLVRPWASPRQLKPHPARWAAQSRTRRWRRRPPGRWPAHSSPGLQSTGARQPKGGWDLNEMRNRRQRRVGWPERAQDGQPRTTVRSSGAAIGSPRQQGQGARRRSVAQRKQALGWRWSAMQYAGQWQRDGLGMPRRHTPKGLGARKAGAGAAGSRQWPAPPAGQRRISTTADLWPSHLAACLLALHLSHSHQPPPSHTHTLPHPPSR